MNRLYCLLVATLLAAATVPTAQAYAGDGEDFDAVEHAIDGVYLELSPLDPIELPRIFLVKKADGGWGFDVFGSTAAALRSGQYGLLHTAEGQAEATLVTDQAALEPLIEAHDHLHADVQRVEGSIFIDFSITRHLVYGILALLIVILVFVGQARRYNNGVGRDSAPKGIWQNMMESVIIFVRDDIARPTIGEDKYEKFLPFLLSVFFFVLVANLMGLVPNGASATANLGVTLALSLVTFAIVHWHANREYWLHIFWPPDVPTWIRFILIPIEFISQMAKYFVLAVRLFANMMGGTIVIFSIIGLTFMATQLFGDAGGYGGAVVSVLLSVLVMFLKILVAFIQAYVFALLSALYIGMAMEEHHHDDHHEHSAEIDTHAAEAVHA